MKRPPFSNASNFVMVSPRRLLKLAALSFLVFLLQSIISILPPLFTAPRGSRAPQRRLVSRAASPVIEAWLVQQERDSEYDELLRDGFSRDKMLLVCISPNVLNVFLL